MPSLLVQGNVYYNAYWVKYKVSQSVIKDNRQGLQVGGVANKLITKHWVSGQIAKDSYRFYLDFFILSSQNVQFNAIKDIDPYVVWKQLSAWNIIK